jgi:molybdopterin converting factor small subunit
MKITIRILADHKKFLPPETDGDTFVMDLFENTHPNEVLSKLQIATDGTYVILVNGRTLSPEKYLNEGDIVFIFPAMAGG